MNGSEFGRLKYRLVELVRDIAYYTGEFTLSSGKKSPFYLDVKKVSLHPEGLFLITSLFRLLLNGISPYPDGVGGPVIGSDPIVGALVYASYGSGGQLHGFLVRSAPREHGRLIKIEGIESLPKEASVVVLEDVVTTGGSLIHAIEATHENELRVLAAFCVVDRQEGGREAIEKLGIPLYALMTIEEVQSQ
jgi:orotate phosphoribosyltransferase